MFAKKKQFCAMVVWRRGHRIRSGTEDPGSNPAMV
jgi:hypothetical protein